MKNQKNKWSSSQISRHRKFIKAERRRLSKFCGHVTRRHEVRDPDNSREEPREKYPCLTKGHKKGKATSQIRNNKNFFKQRGMIGRASERGMYWMKWCHLWIICFFFSVFSLCAGKWLWREKCHPWWGRGGYPQLFQSYYISPAESFIFVLRKYLFKLHSDCILLIFQ